MLKQDEMANKREPFLVLKHERVSQFYKYFILLEYNLMKTFKQFLENLNEGVGSYSVKKVGVEIHKGNPDEYEEDVKTVHYDVHHNGKKVGELSDGLGMNLSGHLHNKNLPALNGYGKGDSGPVSALHGFLKSKTGAKWASNLHKYANNPPLSIDRKGMKPKNSVKEEFSEETEDDMNEDLRKLATAGLVAGGMALGGYSGMKNVSDIKSLEKHHAALVQTNPEKAAELEKHINSAKLTKGNFKLNATTRRHIDAAKKIVGEGQ